MQSSQWVIKRSLEGESRGVYAIKPRDAGVKWMAIDADYGALEDLLKSGSTWQAGIRCAGASRGRFILDS
jgi:hypothetical protein